MYDAGSATTTKVLDPECLAATAERIAVALERIAVALQKPAPPPPPTPEPTIPDGWRQIEVSVPGGSRTLYCAPDGQRYTELRRTASGRWQARNGREFWYDV